MRNPLNNLGNRLLGGRLHLGITANAVALTRSSSAWDKTCKVIGEIGCDANQLHTACATLLAHPFCQNLPLTVTLGPELGQLFVVTPPPKVEKNSVLVAAAAMRYQSLFGKKTFDVCIEADWQTDKPFLACAYPKVLLTSLRDIALLHTTPLISVTAHFVRQWNRWRHHIKPSVWFGIIHDDVLTLAITSTELVGIRAIAIPENGHEFRWIEEQLNRTALQHNFPVPKQICVVGNRHGYWNQPDLAVTERRIVNLTENTADHSHAVSITATPAMQLLVNGVLT